MIYNKIQNEELVRGETFTAFMEKKEQKDIYSLYLPFLKKYTSFSGHFTAFKEESLNKNKSTAGTVTKGDLKRGISKQMGIYLGFTKDYAIDTKNNALKILVSFSETDIMEMKEGDILSFVQRMIRDVFTTALLTNVDFIEYEVTSLKINACLADAVLYNSMIGTVNTGDNSSSSANDNMDEFINQIHIDFDSMDTTVKHFEALNPEFAVGYHKNKVLIEVGKRHEGYQGIVRKNGVLQPEALVMIIGSDKVAVSDNSAAYKMYCKPGKYMVQAKNANGDSQMKEVVVTYRNMTDVDFDLE